MMKFIAGDTRKSSCGGFSKTLVLLLILSSLTLAISHALAFGRGYRSMLSLSDCGWPDGMNSAVVRFIRMQYDGSGWDNGMDAAAGSDTNFLNVFHELTGFRVATAPEKHSIQLLAKYPKAYAPPFVYMTGDGGIQVSSREVRVMNEYLARGGMLFADCGSPQWHASFAAFIEQVFPGESLTNIPKDDVIFQVPFVLTNGAPQIRNYGGTEAMGIKHNGRWVVFYHPGHLADAWKTERPGIDEPAVMDAFSMGINIVYYAFTNYMELTQKYRR